MHDTTTDGVGEGLGLGLGNIGECLCDPLGGKGRCRCDQDDARWEELHLRIRLYEAQTNYCNKNN